MIDKNFDKLSINNKSKKKWSFGDGRKLIVIKYSSCKNDYEKLDLFKNWLCDPNRFTKYISEEKYEFILNSKKKNN
jgi:hypothetical protein